MIFVNHLGNALLSVMCHCENFKGVSPFGKLFCLTRVEFGTNVDFRVLLA